VKTEKPGVRSRQMRRGGEKTASPGYKGVRSPGEADEGAKKNQDRKYALGGKRGKGKRGRKRKGWGPAERKETEGKKEEGQKGGSTSSSSLLRSAENELIESASRTLQKRVNEKKKNRERGKKGGPPKERLGLKGGESLGLCR